MLNSLSIENYRCFDELLLGDLQRVNLIGGKNCTGKTALLEAIWMHSGGNKPSLGFGVNNKRGINAFTPNRFLWDLFRDFNVDKSIVFKSENTKGQSLKTDVYLEQSNVQEIQIEGEGNGGISDQDATKASETSDQIIFKYSSDEETFEGKVYLTKNDDGEPALEQKRPRQPDLDNCVFYDARQPAAEQEKINRWGKLVENRNEDKVLDGLRLVDPRIVSLNQINRAGRPVMMADIENQDQRVPLQLLGDGIMRIFEYLLAIADSDNGMVLIDEIENGLHYSVLKEIWSYLYNVAEKTDVQIFATTHSWECIKAAHDTFSEQDPYDFRFFRMNLKEDRVVSTKYDKTKLETAIEQGLEVR